MRPPSGPEPPCAPPPAHAGDHCFYVEHKADTRIVKGRSSKLVWDESTHNEACEQWIRARFADGSASEPAKFDFCQAMDDPIVFE